MRHQDTAFGTAPGVEELNIGHSIVSRSVFTGVAVAIGTMKRLIAEGADGCA